MKPHSILLQNEAITLSKAIRQEGKKLVFTNGCFDLLHIGHVSYLEKAKSLGDILMVGVNSNRSAKSLKGDKRPLVGQNERAKIIASLHCVDYVVIFDERTPVRLISELKPDIHVKGGDYRLQDLPEYSIVKSYGGTVKILPYVAKRSTTELINKVVKLYGNNS